MSNISSVINRGYDLIVVLDSDSQRWPGDKETYQAVAGQVKVIHSICNETLNAFFLTDISSQCHICINMHKKKFSLRVKTNWPI